MSEPYEVVVLPNKDQDGVLADLEIHFTVGPLAGMKLVGAAVREGKGGGTYVTFPGRAFGVGGERRYFDYIRPVSDDYDEAQEARQQAKAWLKDSWKEAGDGRG